MELLIRAGHSDHTVIDHFLTPAAAGIVAARRQPIDAVVADATVAASRPQLSRLAADAGVPYLVDPLTPLLQSEQPERDPWARLPFATPRPLAPADVDSDALDRFVERVIGFERAAGATHLVPPYLYASKRDGPWWQVNLLLLRRTARYLERAGIDLPVVPVLAVSLREYGPEPAWGKGIDAFLSATTELNTSTVALSWSWSRPAHSSEAALSLLLAATSHAATLASVIGWRSGLFGLALAAVGADGYETGIGEHESLHYGALASSRRPRPQPAGPRSQAFTYFSEFGRSVPRRVGLALLNDRRIEPALVCSADTGCCPGGRDDMLRKWREHTVRARGRELRELELMPNAQPWRLNYVQQRAERASILAANANQALEEAQISMRIPAETYSALRGVAVRLRNPLGARAA